MFCVNLFVSGLSRKIKFLTITSNNRKTYENVLGLVNGYLTSSVKCWTTNIDIHASKDPVMNHHELIKIYLQ